MPNASSNQVPGTESGSYSMAGTSSAQNIPVIVAAKRLPTAKAGGPYKGYRAHQLAAALIHSVVAQTRITPSEICDVILGNATGGGGNVARLAALTAGLPEQVPGLTVDRQCGSGLEAVVLACRLVQAGAGDLYLAGGVESISTAPERALVWRQKMWLGTTASRVPGKMPTPCKAMSGHLGQPTRDVSWMRCCLSPGCYRTKAHAAISIRRSCPASLAYSFPAELSLLAIPARTVMVPLWCWSPLWPVLGL